MASHHVHLIIIFIFLNNILATRNNAYLVINQGVLLLDKNVQNLEKYLFLKNVTGGVKPLSVIVVFS